MSVIMKNTHYTHVTHYCEKKVLKKNQVYAQRTRQDQTIVFKFYLNAKLAVD